MKFGSPALIAGLPASSSWVKVGPPLFWSGPSIGIGIDLVAGSSEDTGAIVITHVIAVRSNRAAVDSDVSAGRTGFQDSVPDLEWPCGEDAAAGAAGVATDRAMADDPATVDPTTTKAGS